jgi:hypothetical protein
MEPARATTVMSCPPIRANWNAKALPICPAPTIAIRSDCGNLSGIVLLLLFARHEMRLAIATL